MKKFLRFITPRLAGTTGVLGAVLFATTVVFLTVIEYEFMVSAGWKPFTDPGRGWPSGLALGGYGWVMNVVFVVSGVLLVVFAVGVRRSIRGGAGSVLLVVAGVAMAMMTFDTDPILREGTRSLHGWVHDISFIVFALSMLAGMFMLSREFRGNAGWERHARFTLVAGILAIICLVFSGVAYYLFIVILLVWIGAMAVRLRNSGNTEGGG